MTPYYNQYSKQFRIIYETNIRKRMEKVGKTTYVETESTF